MVVSRVSFVPALERNTYHCGIVITAQIVRIFHYPPRRILRMPCAAAFINDLLVRHDAADTIAKAHDKCKARASQYVCVYVRLSCHPIPFGLGIAERPRIGQCAHEAHLAKTVRYDTRSLPTQSLQLRRLVWMMQLRERMCLSCLGIAQHEPCVTQLDRR